jgi:hypothetical protein
VRLEREAEQPDGAALIRIFSSPSSFSTTRSRWRRLTWRAAFTMDMSSSYSEAVDTSAALSFPKQDPPHPIPACKMRMPMISAPTFSANCPISLT